jgi:2TM domain
LARKEVITVPTETLLPNERPSAVASTGPESELRQWARKHVERVHKLKLNVAAYVLGMVALTAVWMLVEWHDNGAFERLSGGNNPGDWEPWILYPALIWGFFVALDAMKVYFDRPTTEAEIDRVIRRQ